MQAVEGIYRNGVIVALEPLELEEGEKVRILISRRQSVLPTPSANSPNSGQSLVGTLEILDDDLEAASLEIRQQFLEAIKTSGEELQK